MTRHHINSLKRRKKRLLQRIRDAPEIMRGSFAEVRLTCGKKGCRCQDGDRHKGYRFSYRIHGRSRCVSIPRQWVDEVQERHEAWVAFKALLEELTDVQVQLFQAEMQMKRHQTKGRKR